MSVQAIRDALAGKKTYIAACALVVVCGLEYFGVDVVQGIDQGNALATAWEAMIGIFIRSGVAAGFKGLN